MSVAIDHTRSWLEPADALRIFNYADPEFVEHYQRCGFSLLGDALSPRRGGSRQCRCCAALSRRLRLDWLRS
jgi:hypothetical protein